MVKLFVYGTLLSGNSNHDFMAHAVWISLGVLKGYGLYDLGHYPGIRPKAGRQVLGEVYDVPAADFQRICLLEGEGTLFIKQQAEIELPKRKKIKALVFAYNGACEGKYKELTGKQLWRDNKAYEFKKISNTSD